MSTDCESPVSVKGMRVPSPATIPPRSGAANSRTVLGSNLSRGISPVSGGEGSKPGVEGTLVLPLTTTTTRRRLGV